MVKFIYPIIFLVCKYLLHMVRSHCVKTGRVSSCLDMSGQNILCQKILDLNIFMIQNILGDKQFFDPNFFGLRIILETKSFWIQIFFVLIFLGTKI